MSNELDEIFKDVKSLQIQGATSVAKIVVDALDREQNEMIKESANKDDFISKIKKIAEKLILARPTETMAQNILGFIIFELQDLKIKDLEDCRIEFNKTISEIKNLIEKNEKEFIKNGLNLVESLAKKSRPINVFTHCHSSGARNILKAANDKKIDFKVFNTETRPVFLGRETAKKMVDSGIDVTMVIDSAAPFVISDKSGPKFSIDMVLMGSDAITLNGAAINKIGSYGISLSAFYEKIPLYIVVSLLKVKKGVYNILDIPIETRSCKEVWTDAPKDLNIINLAFDILPSEFITGFITEFGILKPEEIKDIVAKNYPRLL
jgi:ribose 1,5-bisphosphate isomerase